MLNYCRVISPKIVSLVGETWWNDHRAFSLWRVEYIYTYIRIYIYTPYFGHLHVSVQNMPLKILKEYQRSSMSKFAGDESSLNPLDYTQLKCVCVWSLWVVCPWTWRDHNKNMMYLQYWWFNNGIVQPQKKPDKRVAIPRLRAPFCAWENRRSPSWTSDLTWHLQWMNLLMLLSLKVRYTASKERWEYMDHHFKMLFAVLRREPDTNQLKRN